MVGELNTLKILVYFLYISINNEYIFNIINYLYILISIIIKNYYKISNNGKSDIFVFLENCIFQNMET